MDTTIKFWKKYLKADIIERKNIILKCPSMMQLCEDCKNTPKDTKQKILTIMLMSWFDDLIETTKLTKTKKEGNNAKKNNSKTRSKITIKKV